MDFVAFCVLSILWQILSFLFLFSHCSENHFMLQFKDNFVFTNKTYNIWLFGRIHTSSFSWIPKFDRTKYWPSKAYNFCTKANKNIKDVVVSTCRICYLNRLTNFSREYGHIIYLPINRAPSLSVNNDFERKFFALCLCYF